MYHRFEENKYPSTNIRINDFVEQIEIIEEEGLKFVNPKNFKQEMSNNVDQRKVLITIDDGFLSFYENAWPILKEKKIPFILFVSTREVGKNGYMSWAQINEVASYNFVEIGNHSHTHDYLIDFDINENKNDIQTSINIFEKNMNYNSNFFSYPFGEYSLAFKKLISDLGFEFAFGQHSGVIDVTKDPYELPRFPINEKYGEIKRFKTLMKTLPLKYKSITPEDKYLLQSKNPPLVKIEFYENIKNLSQINCFSNEGNRWRNSQISFKEANILEILITEKFVGERGRINCSLKEKNNYWRWLGIQYVISENN